MRYVRTAYRSPAECSTRIMDEIAAMPLAPEDVLAEGQRLEGWARLVRAAKQAWWCSRKGRGRDGG